MKKAQNYGGFIQIILVLVLVALVGGGMYYAGTLKNKPVVVVETPTKEPIALETQKPSMPTVKPTADPTANWKTYKNTKNGFELKIPQIFIYPGEFIPSDSNYFSTKMNTDGPREISGDDLFLEIQTYPNLDISSMQKINSALSANIGSILNQPFQPIGKIEKLSENSFKEYSPDPREAMYYIGLYKNNNVVYVVKLFGIANSNNNQKQIFDQILSTFKFTK